MKSDFCYLPDDAFQASGSLGYDPGVLKLHMVTEVDAELGHV
jgi:hypothetical protein